MFGRLRNQWRDLTKGQPGRRFQNRYYGRRERRASAVAKGVYMVLGTVLVLAGIVLVPAPGPGALVLLIGASMLAEESLVVARACDAVELKIRALIARARRAWKRA